MGKGEGAGEGGERDWNHGLFGCFHDCGNCKSNFHCVYSRVSDKRAGYQKLTNAQEVIRLCRLEFFKNQ